MKLSKVLENCSDWLIDNKLSLHLGKTECILFGPSRKLGKEGQFEVRCHNHVIKASDQVKYLGVTIDKFLKCNLIVNEIITKVNSRLKFLYRNRAWLNTMSRSTLASALIQCYFDYCSTAWYASLTKSLQKKLQVLQNKTIRFIQNLGPRATINCDILESVNTLCVADRVKQLRLNHVYNIFHNTSPRYLHQQFVRNSNATRGGSSFNFNVPRVGAYNSSNFYYHAIIDWNSLPSEIKSTNNKANFKKLVKTHLAHEARQRENREFVCRY
jgi:hypothetical protein